MVTLVFTLRILQDVFLKSTTQTITTSLRLSWTTAKCLTLLCFPQPTYLTVCLLRSKPKHPLQVALLPSSLPLPSSGSILHGTGTCKPCAWFWKPQAGRVSFFWCVGAGSGVAFWCFKTPKINLWVAKVGSLTVFCFDICLWKKFSTSFILFL